MEDGITPVIWRPPTDTTSTITDVVVNAPADQDHIDLYKLTKVDMTFHYVNGDDSVTDTVLTYSYFLVPSEVTAERSVHFTDAGSSLLMVIPIMIIVAVILGILAMIYTRYN